MSKFIKNKFFRLISSLLKPEEKEPFKSKENVTNKYVYNDKKVMEQKIWKKEYNPLRQIVLWGWDDKHNPSFLILYGRHQFKSNGNSEKYTYNLLADDVKYTSYAVFKGKEGHLPSFQAVKIIEDSGHSNSGNDNSPEMYFKKGLKYDWYWQKDSKYKVKEFQNLKPEDQIIFPYFISQCHDEYVQKIKHQKISFYGFKLAKNQDEILKLDEQFAKYLEIITDIMSHTNLYIRKKRLKELLTMDTPKEIYTMLLKIGSTELISGLFLELSRIANPILVEEAKKLVESEMKWADENYAKGVKRCANIYISALDHELRADRINWIRKFLSQMDLHIISINNKNIPPDKIIEGSIYRKYAASGLLRDYYYSYDYKQRQSVKHEAPKRYSTGPYTDGTRLKLIDFKNTLQEAEIYGLADVIGKIAYYLDAPRLTYYFKGSGRTKTLKYFHRYIRRVINSYAESNPDKFMEAMKYLLTSYTKYDYVCKFPGNFQFNQFIKYYLYYDFKEKPPVAWSVRYKWMCNDQLMKLESRHEFMKEIWDTHLQVVVDIAVQAQINQVVKACYYILKDSPNSKEFIENMEYQQLINLTLVSYEPLAEMFMDILKSKIDQLSTFDPKLMICLIGCPDKKMHEFAMEFFKRNNGEFAASDIADLLLLDNLHQWVELFQQNLLSLEEDEYGEFIRCIISSISKFQESDRNLKENVRDILTISTNKIQQLSKTERLKVMSELIDVLLHKPKMPEWIGIFMEEVIFSFSYEDLEDLLTEIIIESLKVSTSSRNKRIISLLESIKTRNLPTDSQILNILEFGTSKIIKMLFSIIRENSEELNNRFSTLLIMLESEVTVLNKKAEEIFDSLPSEKQKKLHAIIIDSPVNKVYSFGLKKLDSIYGDLIPEEFIIQMLEHDSDDVKAYISDKTNKIIDNLGNGNENLFMYYLKTLLLLPNKISKSKDRVYEVIPQFALTYRDKLDEIESILLDIGGSNIIVDSERALVALAKIRQEVITVES